MNPEFTGAGQGARGESPAYRGRIKDEAAASRYLRRRPERHEAEVRLVRRALGHIPRGGSVLDVPCGNGRMTAVLARAGFRVTGADLSEVTLRNCRALAEGADWSATFVSQDLERLAFDDNTFDACLCFRFFHHLPSVEIRERVAGELCRVARTAVLVSYMCPYSPTMLKRRVRQALGGKKSVQHATPLSEVRAYFEKHGFVLREDLAQRRYLRSLHLACFQAVTAQVMSGTAAA